MSKMNSAIDPEPNCGIVMPISAIDSCSDEHWRDVKDILCEAIAEAGFLPQLVSDADDVGIIQKRIIQNLYENPIIVCDVSAKNPNVMFELGMRLAFDRPTIIVKDDKTSYSFDTSPIEHLTYPRDLRFSQIVEFKQFLADKIRATYEKSKNDKNYTTFLKNFGTFKVAELTTEIVPQETLIMEELKAMRRLIMGIYNSNKISAEDSTSISIRNLCMRDAPADVVEAFLRDIQSSGLESPSISSVRNGHIHLRFSDTPSFSKRQAILETAQKYLPDARWLGHPG